MEDALLDRFGTAIRRLRSERGWTQEGLANAADLHRNYVGDLERGKRNPTLHVVAQLADAFELSLSELLEDV
ncbi:helix-turn-helix domain-containing protein [Phycisphaerales bacterium AB-hyl4]|uniref:Helix-turn-helix domain-containing protein n=1 Tax=Natronomicrosphaera hydrolytica TaxID=3242702 RepID=A0ABV4U028_9BACT